MGFLHFADLYHVEGIAVLISSSSETNGQIDGHTFDLKLIMVADHLIIINTIPH